METIQMELRKYQRRAIDSLHTYWAEGKGEHPIIVAGTGAGKSVIQGFFIKEAIEQFPDTRILCLTHVKELIEQNSKRLGLIDPLLPVGIYSSGLKRKDDEQIMFAGIQSIHKKAFDFEPFDLVIIDECFTGDTLISTVSGSKKIKDIDVDKDYVYCINEDNGSLCVDRPLKLAQNGTKDISLITLSDGSKIKCTNTHQIYSEGLWTQAQNLKINQTVNILDMQSNVLAKLLRASVAVVKKLFQTLRGKT